MDRFSTCKGLAQVPLSPEHIESMAGNPCNELLVASYAASPMRTMAIQFVIPPQGVVWQHMLQRATVVDQYCQNSLLPSQLQACPIRKHLGPARQLVRHSLSIWIHVSCIALKQKIISRHPTISSTFWPFTTTNNIQAHSVIMAPFSLDEPRRFSLDISGVLGLLGGGDTLSSMAAVHVYQKRRWLGWHNNPGSFQTAELLRSFAKSNPGSISSKSLSQGIHTDPTILFKLDSLKGPRFRAAHSGTVIEETGYLASLLVKACASLDSEGKVVAGRRTQPVRITVVDLGQAPPSEMRPARASASTLLFAIIPISTSIGTFAICAVYGEWYASLLILIGILASGISSFVLGSADLVFMHPEPAKGSPAGDGILSSDKDIVLLKGTEGAINSITRGTLSLRFLSEGHFNLVRWCSFLFTIQAITQLLLIPQASLFGQTMFLASLCVSALYNTRLSSLDKEKIHQKLMFERIFQNPMLTKYTLGTRTTAVVFMLLVLKLQDPTALLNELLPNDTKVWKQWKATILDWLRHPGAQSSQLGRKVGDMNGFTQQEKELLECLYEDARAAYDGYRDYLQVDSL
ncbi:hypothetical protein JVU11DRAFT_2074 [Chiua virens]|nr:hypothetical protein JVU11DRAFT_2074 [Chiua virens]